MLTIICRWVLNRMCRLRIGWVGLLSGLPFSLCLCLSGSCLLQRGQPNNSSTSAHSHTHPKHNHLRVHSLTHLLAHSLIHSFTLPVMHSLIRTLITFAPPHYASRGTQNDSKLATHVVGWHMSPVPSPIRSSPASLERKTCRQSTQQAVV